MKKKNLLPLIGIISILIILVAVTYRTYQASLFNITASGTASGKLHHSSSNNFFEFLANMMGIQDQYESILTQEPLPNGAGLGTLPNGSALNGNASQGQGLIAGQGSNGASGENNPGNGSGDSDSSQNNSGTNSGVSADQGTGNINSGTNAEQGTGNSNSTNNSGGSADQGTGNTNTENNSGSNTGSNPGDNSAVNSDQGAGNSSGSHSGGSSGSNSGGNSGGSSGGNSGGSSGGNSGGSSGDNSGSGSGVYSGCVLGCYPGCIPGCDAECTPGCLSALGPGNVNNPGNTTSSPSDTVIDPSNLPIMNTLPTDAQAAQNIAQQNQQSQQFAALMAQNQALVTQVKASAEATKYQTIDADSIPAVDATPAPDDLVQKIKSGQLIQH